MGPATKFELMLAIQNHVGAGACVVVVVVAALLRHIGFLSDAAAPVGWALYPHEPPVEHQQPFGL